MAVGARNELTVANSSTVAWVGGGSFDPEHGEAWEMAHRLREGKTNQKH
jgi:hypothetical protein